LIEKKNVYSLKLNITADISAEKVRKSTAKSLCSTLKQAPSF